jgi:hypothetical protein
MRATSAARFAFVAELVSFWVLALTLSWLGTLHSSFETHECRVGGFCLVIKKGSWVKQTPSLDEHGA